MPAPPAGFGFFLQPFYYFQVSKKTEPHQPTRVLVWATYEQDVAQIASRLPENARKYALAPWHCDLTDRRCIHDALVEQVIIVEKGSGDPGQPRSLDIAIRLLGAHRDRHITMKFPSVSHYSIDRPHSDSKRQDVAGHGDVFDDSIKLTADGHVLYTLRLELGKIEIAAKDILFSQEPR
jgi:hypothetical protein